MDALKKIIHPHKADHGHDSATHSNITTTDQQHSSGKLRGSDTGDNLANPFSEPNAQAADRFRQQPHDTTPAGGDRSTAHAYGTGVGVPTEGGLHEHQTTTTDTLGAGAGAGAGVPGAAATSPQPSDSYGPGVNTGGARVVDARMPEEVGNNFPGTNPHPAHNALGTTGEGGGLKYAGGDSTLT